MKPSVLAIIIAALASLPGCAARSATCPHGAIIEGAAARVVGLRATAGLGEPREVRVLVDEPALKVLNIVLRNGTRLPEHDVAVPVTIQALSGAGTVLAGSERLRVDTTHAVVLAANVPHEVEPDAGTDLVLLVTRHGRAAQGH